MNDIHKEVQKQISEMLNKLPRKDNSIKSSISTPKYLGLNIIGNDIDYLPKDKPKEMEFLTFNKFTKDKYGNVETGSISRVARQKK